MKKYEVTMDYIMTATIVVEADDAESAERKASMFVHSRDGFKEYVKVAAPYNVLFGIDHSCGDDGFDIPMEAREFDGLWSGALIDLTKED